MRNALPGGEEAIGEALAQPQVGMGEGPKRALESVDYRLESRPLTDPRPRSLGLDLDLTQNRTRLNHFK